MLLMEVPLGTVKPRNVIASVLILSKKDSLQHFKKFKFVKTGFVVAIFYFISTFELMSSLKTGQKFTKTYIVMQ